MKIENISLKSEADGLVLDVIYMQPEAKIKGIVQISHGMAENKERYLPFMKYLTQKGYVTIIHDHRGHGKSVRQKEDLGYFYEEKANYLIEDVYQVTKWIKEKYPNKKIILFGHSMGSMVVRKYIKKYDKEIDRLIVCGSPSKNPGSKVAYYIAKLEGYRKGEQYRSELLQSLAFGSYAKRFQGESPNRWICSNPLVVKEYDENELCGFTFTTNGFLNLFTLMQDIYSKKGWQRQNLSLPIFFIAGKEDPVIINERKWKQSQEFLKKLGYTNISSKLYENRRHEILNETEYETIWKDIVNWIE